MILWTVLKAWAVINLVAIAGITGFAMARGGQLEKGDGEDGNEEPDSCIR